MNNTGEGLAHCPLCEKEKKREKKEKVLYGVPVCRSCYYNFANFRQLAFLVDFLIWRVVQTVIAMPLIVGLIKRGVPQGSTQILATGILYLLLLVFFFKDGFGGYSPGKALFGLRVVNQSTGKPGTFVASFKRNVILIVPFVPLLVAVMLCKGYRWGDAWANTKVIWKKHKDKAPFLVGGPS
jgi:uncharacterized RDD family membrane protein YckC